MTVQYSTAVSTYTKGEASGAAGRETTPETKIKIIKQ
jgi:hypothetical protein